MVNKEGVAAFHRLALSLGAADDGAPGERGMMYAAFFRDLDGHKIQPYYMA
jgi:predicted lactoylglutathione lyase